MINRVERRWELAPKTHHEYPHSIQIMEGEKIELPFCHKQIHFGNAQFLKKDFSE